MRSLTTPAELLAVDAHRRREQSDELATEEPLQIQLASGNGPRNVAVTMRTPGSDFELAAGFLYSEGIVSERDNIREITYCIDPNISGEQQYNIVTVDLHNAPSALERPERRFTMNSSCGVCGKAAIDDLALRAQPIEDELVVSAGVLTSLPDRMRAAQKIFSSTGGLHAAALFENRGELLVLREDVGRHNAVDKVIGWALLNDRFPLRHTILLVSGRASYELVQKAITARIPIMCAVSAPSSLAVETARAFGLTLAGFLRGQTFNVYAGAQRIAL